MTQTNLKFEAQQVFLRRTVLGNASREFSLVKTVGKCSLGKRSVKNKELTSYVSNTLVTTGCWGFFLIAPCGLQDLSSLTRD